MRGRAEYEQNVANGLRLLADGHAQAALEEFERVLQFLPDLAVAYRYAGLAAIRLNEFDLARDYLVLALHYDGSDVVAAVCLAKEYLRRGRSDSAASVLESAFQINPADSDICYELSRVKYDQGEFKEAVALLRAGLGMSPKHVAFLNLLGLILAREFGRLDEGEAQIRLALEIDPNFPPALSNLGWILSEGGRFEEALTFFDKALEKDPDDTETRIMRAYTLLRNGEFSSGWRDYHARHASPLARQRVFEPARLSDDECLSGKQTVIYAEQGLGDQIMFASCVPDLLATGTNCTLECDARLQVLFERSFPQAHVVSEGDSLISRSAADIRVALGDLPGIFRPNLDSFPLHHGYLRADVARVAAWRRKFTELGPGPYVGISWMGGAAKTRRHLRSIPLSQWGPILGQAAQFISLQYGDSQPDIDAIRDLGITLHDWPEVINDYDETASMVCAMDLVISVCTAVVHLAGALGKAVWVMVPATAEWRYMSSGDGMPWYPSARLFRQSYDSMDTWMPTIQRVSIEFQKMLGQSDENGHILP